MSDCKEAKFSGHNMGGELTYELTLTVEACTRPSQGQAGSNLGKDQIMERVRWSGNSMPSRGAAGL